MFFVLLPFLFFGNTHFVNLQYKRALDTYIHWFLTSSLFNSIWVTGVCRLLAFSVYIQSIILKLGQMRVARELASFWLAFSLIRLDRVVFL